MTGFLPYGSDDVSVIEFASFTSAGDIGSASLTEPTLSVDFNEDGFFAPNDGASVTYDSTFAANFLTEGTCTVWMEHPILRNDFLSSERLPAWVLRVSDATAGNCNIYKSTTADLTSDYRYSQIGAVTPERARTDNASYSDTNSTRPHHVRIDYSWNATTTQIYVDYLKVLDTTHQVAYTGPTGFILGGNGNGSNPDERVKNVQWSNQQIVLDPTANATIAVIGDVLLKSSNYQDNSIHYVGWQTDDYGDGSLVSPKAAHQQNIIPQLHSRLAEAGINLPTETLTTYLRQGARWNTEGSANTMQQRIDAYIGGLGEFPTPGIGTADIVIAAAGFQDIVEFKAETVTLANIIAGIDAAVARILPTCGYLVLVTIPEQTLSYEARTHICQVNDHIKGLEIGNAKIICADINPYTKHNPWTVNGYSTDHLGATLYADVIAPKLIALISPPVISNIVMEYDAGTITATCDSNMGHGTMYFALRDDRPWNTTPNTVLASTDQSEVINALSGSLGNLSYVESQKAATQHTFTANVAAAYGMLFHTDWQDDMVIEFTVSAGTEVTIPTNGGGLWRGFVDFGDSTGKAQYSSRTDTSFTHTYAADGVYECRISGLAQYIHMPSATTATRNAVTKIRMGLTRITNASNIATGCVNLTSFTSDSLSVWETTLGAGQLFDGCVKLTELEVSGWKTNGFKQVNAAFQNVPCRDIDVSSWNFEGINAASAANFMTGSGMRTETYAKLLANLATQTLKTGVIIDFGYSTYPASSQTDRDAVTAQGWTISDGGVAA